MHALKFVSTGHKMPSQLDGSFCRTQSSDANVEEWPVSETGAASERHPVLGHYVGEEATGAITNRSAQAVITSHARNQQC